MTNKDAPACWLLNGKRHLYDGPAVAPNGDRLRYLNGEKHRVDGPAYVTRNGDKVWYLNGHQHRVDGPATER